MLITGYLAGHISEPDNSIRNNVKSDAGKTEALRSPLCSGHGIGERKGGEARSGENSPSIEGVNVKLGAEARWHTGEDRGPLHPGVRTTGGSHFGPCVVRWLGPTFCSSSSKVGMAWNGEL